MEGADIDLFNISQISNGIGLRAPNYEEESHQLTLSVTDGIGLVDQILNYCKYVNEAPYAIDNFHLFLHQKMRTLNQNQSLERLVQTIDILYAPDQLILVMEQLNINL